jgi:hypothetical protein
MHLQNLVTDMNLTLEDLKHIRRLPSFHEVSREIRQRNDTKQYIYIESESSWRNGVDDYFSWYYLTDADIIKYVTNADKNKYGLY